MMGDAMDLLLWRHAEAETVQEGWSDDDRPLTGKGKRQARAMAEWLSRHAPAHIRVVSSPVQRTVATAEALTRRYNLNGLLRPDQSVDNLLEAAGWPDQVAPVVVVGHQPTLGLAAARLLGVGDQGLSIRKGALWWLQRQWRDGAHRVVLLTVQDADLLG
jgi:phosphohistidine phosphatase